MSPLLCQSRLIPLSSTPKSLNLNNHGTMGVTKYYKKFRSELVPHHTNISLIASASTPQSNMRLLRRWVSKEYSYAILFMYL